MMFEHLPRWLGGLLHNVRAGHSKLVIVTPGLTLGEGAIDLTSPAFTQGDRLPRRFTADGEGLAPPLAWRGVPEGTVALVLVIQDPDAPFPDPVLHAVAWPLDPATVTLPEGSLSDAIPLEWQPPDPPPGHGVHDYVFQIFALDSDAPVGERPDREQLVAALKGHVLAAGMLSATYSREG